MDRLAMLTEIRRVIDVGPKADGTIAREDEALLLEIGDWMRKNGEAIYDTKPWRVFGEGPTKGEEGQFTDGTVKGFTSEDIRFTAKGGSLYAIIMKRQRDGQACIRSLGIANASHKPHFHGIIKEVTLPGEKAPVAWERKEDGLHVGLAPCEGDLPVVIKITLE